MMRLFEKRHNYKGFQVEPGFVNWLEGIDDEEFITSGFSSGSQLKAYKYVGDDIWEEQEWREYDRQEEIEDLQYSFFNQQDMEIEILAPLEEGGECV